MVALRTRDGFCLTSDDDGHWYVVPFTRLAEWDAWVQNGDDDDDLPTWAEAVGGAPNRVVFSRYEII